MLPSYCSDLIQGFSTEDDRGTHDGSGALITTSQTLSVPSITGKGIIQDKCDSYDFFWKWKADLRTCPFDVPPAWCEAPARDIALLLFRQLSTNLRGPGRAQQREQVDGLIQRSTAFNNAAHHIWTVTINKKARQNHKSRHGTCWAFLNQDLINAELTHVNCKLLISDNVATANSVSFRKKLEQFSAQSGKAWLEVKTRVRCPSRASRSESDSARCSRAALLPEDIRRQMWQLWQIHSSCESSCESEWVDRQCIIIFQSLELYLYLSSFFIITLYCPHVCIYSEEMFAWHICRLSRKMANIVNVRCLMHQTLQWKTLWTN